MPKQRVCLITPGHLSTNPRLVKEADALAEAGYDVEVICGDYMEWGRREDRAFASRPWRLSANVTFGPGSPLRLRVRELARRHGAGFLVSRLGVRHRAVIRAAWHSAAPDLIKAALGVEADHYIAHYVAALPAAAIAARAHRASFSFDAEDFHLGDPPEGAEYDIARAMTRAIEGSYLPNCAFVTAASPEIADAYVEAYAIPRPSVVLNVFPCCHAPAGPTARGSVAGPSVYWFSQTIGPDRGLECALRAIARAKSRPHLYLRGEPAKGYTDELERLAAQTSVADRLHFLLRASPLDMERLAAAFDVGLVGETGHTPNRRIALTNKLFSYLLAGIPVVASSIPAHRTFANEVKGAIELYDVDDHEALASVLDAFFADPDVLARARAAAYRLGQTRFNWDVEKRIVTDAVAATLSGRRAACADVALSTGFVRPTVP